MRIAIFCHSVLSDWNHGNAHFLRGLVTELSARGHDVVCFEPRDAWSLANLVADEGVVPVRRVRAWYPALRVRRYRLDEIDLERAIEDRDLVLVHEWNEPELVARLGALRARRRFGLLFHDTHHRAVTDPGSISRYDLSRYDGVIAFGAVLRDLYLRERWARRAWVLHEAADVRVFRPLLFERTWDIVWIGNFGDEERTAELREYLLEPARELALTGLVHGVRYPDSALRAVADAGLHYAGYLPNLDVPAAFARAAVTVHVPRGPYARALPGIPTIRVFEALACGIPLVTAPWEDAEELFMPGADFLVAHSGAEMQQHLRTLLHEPEWAAALAGHGRRTILARHTCAHRADALLAIAADIGADARVAPTLVGELGA